MKICSKCKTEKVFEAFYSSVRGLDAYCRECRKAYSRSRQDRFDMIKLRYGLSREDYLALVERSDGKCEMCGDRFSKTPFVEHHHESGRVRGLVCQPCNLAIAIVEGNRLELACEWVASR